MLRCMSPRAPEPPLPGGASSPASLPVSARQGPGGKQWAAGGGGNMEDDVGDEVTNTRGSRAKLSSFSCSHRFPWKSKSVREGLIASRLTLSNAKCGVTGKRGAGCNWTLQGSRISGSRFRAHMPPLRTVICPPYVSFLDRRLWRKMWVKFPSTARP